MLVLTRKENESVVITTESGEKIRVMVSSIRGDKVRLGFIATRETHIVRSEIADRK